MTRATCSSTLHRRIRMAQRLAADVSRTSGPIGTIGKVAGKFARSAEAHAQSGQCTTAHRDLRTAITAVRRALKKAGR